MCEFYRNSTIHQRKECAHKIMMEGNGYNLIIKRKGTMNTLQDKIISSLIGSAMVTL